MMTLSDIIGVIMFESGQFIVGDTLDVLGMSTHKFWNYIVHNRLKFYQRYRPLTKTFNRKSDFTTTYGSHIFFGRNSDPEAFPFDNRVKSADIEEVPKWISNVVPLGVSKKLLTVDLIKYSRYNRIGEVDTVTEPRKFYWRYETYHHDDLYPPREYGIIYLTEDGMMEVRAHYDYKIDTTLDSDGEVIEAEISGIDEGKDRIFLDLVLAKFLIMIGRSRRMFRMEAFPVEFDGGEAYSEGRELEETTLQSLYEQSNWYDAIKN